MVSVLHDFGGQSCQSLVWSGTTTGLLPTSTFEAPSLLCRESNSWGFVLGSLHSVLCFGWPVEEGSIWKG